MGACNYDFVSSKHYHTIDRFLDRRKDFIVLGLCGKTGSGVSTTANILQKDFSELNLPRPGDELGDDVEAHEYRILYKYAQKHWLPFFRIKASAIITAHILEKGKDAFSAFLASLFPDSFNNEGDIKEYISAFFSGKMRFCIYDEIEESDKVRNLITAELFTSADEGKIGQLLENINLKSRPLISKNLECTDNGNASSIEIRIGGEKIKGKYYDNGLVEFETTELYKLFKTYIKCRTNKQGFDNPLWLIILKRFIYDFLPMETKKLWNELSNKVTGLGVMAQQQLGINIRICGEPYYDAAKAMFQPEAYLTIVEEINHCIKLLVAYLNWRKSAIENNSTIEIEGTNYDRLHNENHNETKCTNAAVKTEPAMRSVIVIDSIKNPYESMYLKSRYTNYYLLGIYTEDSARKSRLLNEERIALKFVESIDIIEQQSAFKKLWKKYDSAVTVIAGKWNEELVWFNSLQSQIPDGLEKSELERSKSFNHHVEISKHIHLLELMADIARKHDFVEIQEKCRSQIDKLKNNDDVKVLLDKDIAVNAMMAIKESGLIDEISFILQNVEGCLQDADIFINNEADNKNHILLKKKLIRYVSLIMNPGLVLPTPVERCMQFAYTAKLNSGCISRQVGAAITDSNYHLLSIGWNQQPEGQLPCLYRDLCSLYYKWSKDSYSEYECNDKEDIQKCIEKPVKELLSKPECPLNAKGKLPVFCFKDLYNSITGTNNQVHPRSLHAEETAFLNLKQYDCTDGILFTTSSPCELCAKKARYMGIKTIYYIEPYAGLSFSHVLKIGAIATQPKMLLFSGAVGRAYTQLYTPLMPQKDEITFWLGAKLDANILHTLENKCNTKQAKSASLSTSNQSGQGCCANSSTKQGDAVGEQ